MFVVLPTNVLTKVLFLFTIPCPPLIIIFIGEGIKEKLNERKEQKGELKNE